MTTFEEIPQASDKTIEENELAERRKEKFNEMLTLLENSSAKVKLFKMAKDFEEEEKKMTDQGGMINVSTKKQKTPYTTNAFSPQSFLPPALLEDSDVVIYKQILLHLKNDFRI